MKKKVIYILAVSLLAAAAFSGTASADQLPTNEKAQTPRNTIGQVVTIETDHFVIERNGEQQAILINEETRFRSKPGESPPGYDQLATGMWVAVRGTPGETGDLIAVLVILLPEDFSPDSLRGERFLGEVTKVNNGQNSFTVITRAEEEITVFTDEKTRFLNGISELKDLEHGSQVGVVAVEQQDGSLLAKLVAGAKLNQRPSTNRVSGKVETLTNDALTLLMRGDNSQTFTITTETKFRSLDGSISELAELQSGDIVVVLFEGDPDSDLVALNVIAAGEKLSQAVKTLQRAGGEVQSAGGSHLTINTPSGETLNFTVGENVRIRGLGGETALNELKNGMRVMVLYNTDQEGNLVARAILVGEGDKPFSGKPDPQNSLHRDQDSPLP
ncbi:MAG: DUF5666 domain-containing protein [Chloroflexota bacterium]